MRKYIIVALGVALLVAAFFISQLFGGEKGEPPAAKPQKAMPTVFVSTVKNETQPITVTSTGPLMAKDRVEIFAEVQGVFRPTTKPFKAGVAYRAGETLLAMDASEQYANLQAQKSTLYSQIAGMMADLKIDYSDAFPNWEQYLKDFAVDQPIKPLPKPLSEKERVFVSTKNIPTAYHNIRSLEIRQGKYTIRAPFSGVLTEALITPGTLVRPGQKLGDFVSNRVYEMQVAVGVSLMPFLKVGKQVMVRGVTNKQKNWTGKVVRINPKVDRASQTFDLFLELSGEGLAEGLYLEAVIEAKQEKDAFELDRSLLINDQEVFAVKDSLLQKVAVEPIYYNPKTVVVKGLENGEVILSKSIPGAYEGMKVKPYQPVN